MPEPDISIWRLHPNAEFEVGIQDLGKPFDPAFSLWGGHMALHIHARRDAWQRRYGLNMSQIPSLQNGWSAEISESLFGSVLSA